MTVPIDTCIAASRVLARVDTQSPSPNIASTKGRASPSKVAKYPWIGTLKIFRASYKNSVRMESTSTSRTPEVRCGPRFYRCSIATRVYPFVA